MSQNDDVTFKLLHGNISKPQYNFFGSAKNYTVEALEHLILIILIYSAVCVVLYACIKWKTISFTNHLKDTRRIMIFTAHSDDECMFFGPTIINLTKNNDHVIYLTCFSTGANYGMGKIRKNELYKACKVLGVDEGAVIIKNHTLLPDNINKRWPADLLAKIILNYVEMYNIDTVITFDKHGVSRHANHCSIYYAVAFLCMEHLLPPDCKIYTLESINFIRKYWFILDIPLCFFLSSYRYILSFNEREMLKLAMHQHKSQMIWYRKLYLYFSRYILINTLEEMDPLSIEFDFVDD